jgi:hypothetical protein
LPTEFLFTPAEIEAQDKEKSLPAQVAPVIETSADHESPTGLRPTIRQLMIVVLWAALITAATRQMFRWGLYGTTTENLCMNISMQLGFYLMPILAGLLWLFDRPGRVGRWYVSGCMIATHFLGGFAFTLQDLVCYVLTGKPNMLFPMWQALGLLGFWCGWMQWKTFRPRECPACGRRSVIPVAHRFHPRHKRKYNLGTHGWCATCGASFERKGLEPWKSMESL